MRLQWTQLRKNVNDFCRSKSGSTTTDTMAHIITCWRISCEVGWCFCPGCPWSSSASIVGSAQSRIYRWGGCSFAAILRNIGSLCPLPEGRKSCLSCDNKRDAFLFCSFDGCLLSYFHVPIWTRKMLLICRQPWIARTQSLGYLPWICLQSFWCGSTKYEVWVAHTYQKIIIVPTYFPALTAE